MESLLTRDVLDWLCDPETPGARYLAFRDLLNLPEDDPLLISAMKTAHEEGPIADILNNMNDEGYWVEPGPGYRPKYRSTVWAIILLAQLGASSYQDDRIAAGCTYLLDQALTQRGQFTISGTPSTNVDCLQGNLCWALNELKFEDKRLDTAYEWMARSVTGAGVAPFSDKKSPIRYYSGNIGPNFQCGANNKLSCAWGGAKVMMAFSILSVEKRTPIIQKAIDMGVDFLLSVDPAEATYPSGYSRNPSGNWWKFGFPLFYVTDLLQIVEGLVKLGYGEDPRLSGALELVKEKRDKDGRWPLEYGYRSKTWVDFGDMKKPNKWVTIRALRTLGTI